MGEKIKKFEQVRLDADGARKAFPSKITPYIECLMPSSEPIRKMYTKTEEEEVKSESKATDFFSGKEPGLGCIDRVYEDRVALKVTGECFAHCRYCIRSFVKSTKDANPSKEELDMAIKYLKQHSEINQVLITGGEPILSNNIFYLLHELDDIKHIRLIRVAARVFAQDPGFVTDELADRLSNYNKAGRPLNLNVCFNHPDELTTEAVCAVQKVIQRGIHLRNQTVLLRGINATINAQLNLARLLVENNIQPYYLFHCYPTIGKDQLRTTVQQGLDIIRELNAYSGTLIPHYAIASDIGKIRLSFDKKLEYSADRKNVILETPYKAERYRRYTNNNTLPDGYYVDSSGFIVAVYPDGKD